MPFCKKCGEWCMYEDSHNCPPIFEVQHLGYHCDDEWEEIRAIDEKEAAEKWAEKDDIDSAEYSIVSGSPAEVNVRKKGETTYTSYTVTGEGVPTYYATLDDK